MRLRIAVAALGLAISACDASDAPTTPAADVSVGADAEVPGDDAAAVEDVAAQSDAVGDDDVEAPEADTELPEADSDAPADDVTTPAEDTVSLEDTTPAEDVNTAEDTAAPGPSVTNGQAVYTANCAGCHGYAGTQNPSVDLKTRSGDAIARAVRQGVGYMPAFDAVTISDAALADLIAYIGTL
jgi:mono/diheme cytochrome c family protein